MPGIKLSTLQTKLKRANARWTACGSSRLEVFTAGPTTMCGINSMDEIKTVGAAVGR